MDVSVTDVFPLFARRTNTGNYVDEREQSGAFGDVLGQGLGGE